MLEKSASLRTPLPVSDFATCDLSDYWIAQPSTRPSTPIPRGVVGNARSQRNGARFPHGALRGGNMAELQLEPGILGSRAPPFCFPFVETHIRLRRVFRAPALCVWRLCPSPGGPRYDTERKMADLRLVSGILGVRGAAFCFPFVAPRLLWFRVFSAPAFGVVR